MGCDIHLYIEYRRPGSAEWACFGSRFSMMRVYRLFGVLAGVRDGEPMYPPRGVPCDIGWTAKWDNGLVVVEEGPCASGTCLRSSANKWVSEGISKWTGERTVTHPDWHTHSWLLVEEFEKALINYASTSIHGVPIDYTAVLAAMKSLASNGQDVRVVFWFDN